MAKIEIDGEKYTVLDSMGYNHDVGGYVKEVETDAGPKMAVKQSGGRWRFWTARDRTEPLRGMSEQHVCPDGVARPLKTSPVKLPIKGDPRNPDGPAYYQRIGCPFCGVVGRKLVPPGNTE